MASLVYHAPFGPSSDSPFDSAILDIAGTGPLCIVSPYIDVSYLTRIIARADHWRLLSDAEAWLSSLSLMTRPAAWQFIRENIDRIHHCAGVHAKVVIGARSGIIGSANLTRSGMLHRHEMAIVVDDRRLVDELQTWFEALWQETTQPSVDETNAFVQWLDELAAKGTTAQQRFVISSPARRVRARLVAEADSRGRSAPISAAFDLTSAAKNVVVSLQEHYESVDAAIGAMLNRWTRSQLKLADVILEVRRAFPRARVREIYLLLIQHCANHPRSAFVDGTENRLVLRQGVFWMATRDDVASAVAPFDAFLCYLLQHLTFDASRALPSEATIESATGFGGATQVALVEELLNAGLLEMEDVPGELPRYTLHANFEWDGRYRLFPRSASVCRAAQKALSTNDEITLASKSDITGLGGYGREVPSAFDRAWNTVQTDNHARTKANGTPPNLDHALSRLLTALFNGQSFKASNADELKALVTSRLQIPQAMAAEIVDRSPGVPTVVCRIDDGSNGLQLDVDPELTWSALAAYPKTQEACERFLNIR